MNLKNLAQGLYDKHQRFLKHYFFIFIILLFFIRSICFIYQHGGTEQDSGWYIGMAKNIATKGIYASYLNLTTTEEPGGFPNIHRRYSVQDSKGFTYFPEGISVGPGHLFPVAAIIKLFGSGRFQFNIFSFFTFALLFLLFFRFLYRTGGYPALFCFLIWIWIVPQLWVNFSYESYAESTGMLYVLISYFLINRYYVNGRNSFIVLSGLSFAFAFLTKNLYAMYITSFVAIGIYDLISYGKYRKLFILKKWLLWFLGAGVPVAMFELYRYLYITIKFGDHAYVLSNKAIKLLYEQAGAGIENLSKLDLEALYAKLLIWIDLGVSWPHLLWLFAIAGFIYAFFLKKDQLRLHILFTVGIVGHFGWFLFLSSTGWFRHIWPAMVISMIYICILIGDGLYRIFAPMYLQIQHKYKSIIIIALMIPATIGVLNISFNARHIFPTFHISQESVDFWHRLRFLRQKNRIGLPVTHIFPKKEQNEIIEYLNNNLQKRDKLFFYQWFYSVELAPYVDRIFYSLNHYFKNRTNILRNNENPILIFSPFSKGEYPYSYISREHFKKAVSQLCTYTIYTNKHYHACRLK